MKNEHVHFVLHSIFRNFAENSALDRTFHSRITIPAFLTVVVLAGMGFFLLWQRTGVAPFLGLALFALCAAEVERLIHSEFVVTDDGRLVVRRGRLSKEKVVPLTDITELKELKMLWGMGSYILVRYGVNRYITLQPANTHSLYETIRAQLDQMAETQNKQTEQNNNEI